MANKRITDVDYIDKLDPNDSIFVNSDNAIKQVPSGSIIIPVENGGTGVSTTEEIIETLGLSPLATTNIVPVTKGGTGAVNATAARANLGLGPLAAIDVVPVANGGTGAAEGNVGLANLFASGITTLTYGLQYGDTLPSSGIEGQIFFVKI